MTGRGDVLGEKMLETGTTLEHAIRTACHVIQQPKVIVVDSQAICLDAETEQGVTLSGVSPDVFG